MAIIAICFNDTKDNDRHKYSVECLKSLSDTVDLNKNWVVLINNNSCEETFKLLSDFQTNNHDKEKIPFVIHNKENIGTAAGINKAIRLRVMGEVVIKADNDITWHQSGWVEQLESVMVEDITIGICGLKRDDLMQYPNHSDERYRTTLESLPNGLIIENCDDIMGTCTAFNPLLLDRIGFMQQFSQYGYDDALMSIRSISAGFRNCFLPNIKITHLDDGANPYAEWKRKEAAIYAGENAILCEMYKNHKLNPFYDGGFDES